MSSPSEGKPGGATVENRGRRVIDLKHAIREVRIAHAERNDVVSDLHETELARLELLAEALEAVAKDMPADHDQLLLGMLPGQTPRYWVDATSFVMMARDKRRYRFLKDTRLGRTELAESADVHEIADKVTRYVAERIVERDQAVESDWLSKAVRARQSALVPPRPSGESFALIWGLCGFGLGMIAGMFLLVAYAWFFAG